MARVVFVNEHLVVDAEAGRPLEDVARSAGVTLGAVCWVDEGTPGAGGARTLGERMRRLSGWRRLPRSVVVNGDLKVYSAPAASNRVGLPREIAGPPEPPREGGAPRKPDDAASTAAHVYGHPASAGRGLEVAAAKIPEPPSSHPNAARPLSTYPAAPESEHEHDD